MITEPGIDGLVAQDESVFEGIQNKIRISLEKNNAGMIFITGHYDCKGNPVDESTHKKHIQSSVERLKAVFAELDVVGVWINSSWECEQL